MSAFFNGMVFGFLLGGFVVGMVVRDYYTDVICDLEDGD